jgi:two-component system nitrogen regulation response regulator GlnG
VLIRGESGTGKELVARAIYQHSARADHPFVAINCGAIPENLVESELFGHEKGAFTGAERRRIGKFEQANGGTVFLDEVGDLPLLAQVKMLRVLQERAFERVGGNETVTTDIRVIAATNADLEGMVEAGTFRRDLFFRLNVFGIDLPPLRERGEDLNRLIEHYLQRFRAEMHSTVTEISPEAMAALEHYSWPGNIRELQSVLRQAMLSARGAVLLPDDLPQWLRNPPKAPIPPATNDWGPFVESRIAAGTHELYDEALKRMEAEVLVHVLKHTQGNQVQAAKILGITRGNLRTKLRVLGITINRAVWAEAEHGEG